MNVTLTDTSSSRMMGFMLIGALIMLHASLTRAVPNLLLGDSWSAKLAAACRTTEGCVNVQVTPTQSFGFWVGRNVVVTARPGQESQAASRVNDAVGTVGRIYSKVSAVSLANGEKK